MKKLISLFLLSAISLFAQAGAATSANVGQTVVLTATVTAGTAPLSYAWFKNGSAIGSALTGSALTIPNIQLSDGGTYTVTVSNSAGSTTSPGVVIAVSQVIPAGASITITVK